MPLRNLFVRKFFLPVWAILFSFKLISAQEIQLSDSCRYWMDTQNRPASDCPSQNKPGDVLQRKQRVIALADRILKARNVQDIGAVLSDPRYRLRPEPTPRTFSAWMSDEAASKVKRKLDGYAWWLADQIREGFSKGKRADGQGVDGRVEDLERQLNYLRTHLGSVEETAKTMDGSREFGAKELTAIGGESNDQPRGAPPAGKPYTLVEPKSSMPSVAYLVPPAPKAMQGASIKSRSPWEDTVDPGADPCQDFYKYACGTWDKEHKLEPEDAFFNRFSELGDRIYSNLRYIQQEIERKGNGRSPEEEKFNDIYSGCVNEWVIETRGLAPLEPELRMINSMTTKADLAHAAAHLSLIGTPVMFSVGSAQDMRDSQKVLLQVADGGNLLPDRDYYFLPKYAAERKDFLKYAEKMFSLIGDRPAVAANEAKAVLEIETLLMQGSEESANQRSPEAHYHPEDASAFQKKHRSFDWQAYFTEIESPSAPQINIWSPGFFDKLEAVIQSVPLDGWKSYFRLHLVDSNGFFLPSAFRQEQFDFYDSKLDGVKKMPRRDSECLGFAQHAMGNFIGRLYVERHFDPTVKAKAILLIQNMKSAMGDEIEAVPWMSEETKAGARAKLESTIDNVGYPDHWTDYSSLRIVQGDALGNLHRISEFYQKRELGKIGQPFNRGDWHMNPQTVNAYYDFGSNSINFPAGILQSPFFDPKADAAENFGGIGGIIGHEITHGFDDQGRKYDERGNLRDWWNPTDAAAFGERAQCIEKQYSEMTMGRDPRNHGKPIKVNGKLTLGENIADNGGLFLAYRAFEKSQDAEEGRIINGYTPEQRFFLGYGRVWCGNEREEYTKMMSSTNPHPPDRLRVNGVVSNMPEFQKAFQCRQDAPMARPNPCKVW